MTSTSPCQLIGCKNDCPHKGPTSFRPLLPPAGPCPRWCKNNASKPHPVYLFGVGMDFDNQLRVYENIARRQYEDILNALCLEKLPGWFDQMLSQSILPSLKRIGFDETISKGLFEIAPSSWNQMGPANDKIIAFHPKIDQEIEEIRQGLKLKFGNNGGTVSRSTGSASTAVYGTINKKQSPDHLFDILDEIATSWIVLPRAFRFLKKQQCRYLPAYLTIIDRETSESFLMLFSRITVEFVGNFSLKFAARSHQPAQITKLLFYGYAALFWKTLRCPPQNLESSAAFDNFFNWICRLVHKNDCLGKAELRSIDQMKRMKQAAFPTTAFNTTGTPGRAKSSHFMVTLRHGCLGMATVLKYFGIDQFLETRQSGGRFQSPSFQNDLHGLLHTIQTNYHLESKRTRGFIKQFLDCLGSAYELLQPDIHQIGWKFLIRRFNNVQILLNK